MMVCGDVGIGSEEQLVGEWVEDTNDDEKLEPRTQRGSESMRKRRKLTIGNNRNPNHIMRTCVFKHGVEIAPPRMNLTLEASSNGQCRTATREGMAPPTHHSGFFCHAKASTMARASCSP